jgi:hypothetical protein
MRRMFVVHALIAFFVILLIPSDAFAWGPGMHVDVAMTVLGDLSSVVPVIRELIKRFPEAYIYGTASPDIVVGKKYAGYLHHCHSWRIGWLILHEAETDRQRAAAYGYLTHLAADVVAHNYFIPVKIIRSYNAKLLTHTYWEMRFDLGVTDEVWEKLKMVTELDIKEFDELLERVLRKTIFSFSTNKKIFNSILMLQKMRSLRASLSIYAKRSRFDIAHENREHYRELAMESVLDFLSHPESAACLDVDPTGGAKLSYAKNLRRRMREMMERKLLTEVQADKLVDLAKERLAVAIYRPEMILPDVVDVI